MRKKDFRERLSEGVILADGAMGTYLHRRGVPMDRCFPEQCLSAPDEVEAIHREYVEAGAEILQTNTYGAHSIYLERFGLAHEVRRVNIHAARLARQACDGSCYVAGTVGPLGASLRPLGNVALDDAETAFRSQISALVEGGVDLIIIETISELTEFEVALAAARAVCDLPIVINKTFTEDGRTLMGELPHEVVARAAAGGADVVGANCTVGPQRMLDIIERMGQRASLPLSAMPTAGLPRLVEGRIDYHAEPEYMAHYARLLAEAGATIVGACCGSTPKHIAAMAGALRDVRVGIRRRSVRVEAAAGEAQEPAPLASRSRLGEQLGREFVVAVDMELPRTHDLAPTVRQARELQDAEVDTLMFSDPLRARLVVHPLVVAHRLQSELGIECVQAYACRDRNVLGIQSDLLAAQVQGVRNILVSVGDPANLGDYPTAKTLTDIGPVGLMRVLDAMNRGLDLAGNSIGDPTTFVALVAGNPCSHDMASEMRRLTEQVAFGAAAIVTQPLFSLDLLDSFLEAVGDLGVPVIVGLMPLRSLAHAEYLHNEVTGMEIPQPLRGRLRTATDPYREGLEIARVMLERLPRRVAGVHIVPPFQKQERVLSILESLDIGSIRGVPVGGR